MATSSPPKFHRRTAHGFTLVELLVATAVFALMVALLLTAVSHVTAAWRNADGQKSRRENARVVLDLMARDLRGAIPPHPSSSTNAVPFTLNPSGFSSGNGSDSLFWQTALPADRTKTDISTVGYFVRENLRALCRLSTNGSVPNAWDDADTLAPATESDDYRGLLADGVLGLFVSLFDKNGNEIAATGDHSTFETNLPASATITLLVADPATLRRHPNLTVTTNDLANPPQGVQVFTARVDVPAGQ